MLRSSVGSLPIDRISVTEVAENLDAYMKEIQQQLLSGSFMPSPVKGVAIPKTKGGSRQLGIPTVIDRWVMQAIAQVLTPIFDPTCSIVLRK